MGGNRMWAILLLGVSLGCGSRGAPATQMSFETADTLISEFDANQISAVDESQTQSLIYWVKYNVECEQKDVKRRAIAQEFIAEFPRHEDAPKMLLWLARTTSDERKATPLYRRIVEQYPNTSFAESASQQLRQIDAIGKPFSLSFKDAITGKQVSVAELKGKIVAIDFWSTRCGPCVAEMPKLKTLYAKYKDQGVEFIGVSLDQPEGEGGLAQLRQCVEKIQIPWPQYFQGNGWESEFSSAWGIDSIPRMFVVDRNGNLFSTDARDKLDEMLPILTARSASK